ncbi:MAG: hypothetical protein M1570_10605 [Chloroflexi bacterium]|nr:hypothetical protein [Chloroflexota bacterium]
MLVALLAVTFVIAFLVSTVVVFVFGKPIDAILRRILSEDISQAWTRYLKFAIYVMGIGGGVRVWDYEKYLTPIQPYNAVLPLTSDRWALEIYQTIISTLQATVTILLVFFVFALIAMVVVRAVEARTPRVEPQR